MKKNDEKDKKNAPSFKELRKENEQNEKDKQINTPQKIDDDLGMMPYDEDTLRTFSFKEMNFKDMTSAQKNVLTVIIIFLVLFIISSLLPTFFKWFERSNIANIRFRPKEEVEEVIDDSSYAYEGDFIILGNNTSLTLNNVKFYNFTKSSDYTLVFNYISENDIEDVSSLKIYVEYYNYSKTLIQRFEFTTANNRIKKDTKYFAYNTMSENNFNKTHYVRIRVISDVEKDPNGEDYDPTNPNNPTPYNPDDPTNPTNPTDPTDPTDPSGNGGTSTSEEDPTKEEDDKSSSLICRKVNVDKDLRIYETFTSYYEQGTLSKYKVVYNIEGVIDYKLPSNYSKYYKQMLKKYKKLNETVGITASIEDNVYNATLSYEVDLSLYHYVNLDDYEKGTKIYEVMENYKADFDLEIGHDNTKSDTSKELQKSGYICG